MNADRRRRIEAVFEAALDRAPERRDEFLAGECAGDSGLLAEARAMLAAHELAERFFDAPADGEAGTEERMEIGAYRVVREIGRGGMGVVYLAERADGHYRRRVAIKLIASAHADDPNHRRFLAERQILAGLDHPDIARLLDGGVTDDGRPYLVLEYVEGLPITEYCDRHRLTVAERLRLFVDVCAAVQHAHRNLVIHRDLKPGNILVTAERRVRLLDFGIAKLVNPELSAAEAPVTRFDARVMTPEFASPEQVRGEVVSTASDVYALGVLLYQLLTGSSPYRLRTGSPAELMRAICDIAPERPSQRIGRTEAAGPGRFDAEPLTPQRRAADRATTADRLRRTLRGDLDCIVEMALRKEPARRYASADLLREDVLRHLDGLPVLAHRGSRRYRAGKLLKRHRAAATALAMVAVALVGGLGAALWQAALAERQRARAEAAHAEAAQALSQSREVTNFLMMLFEAADADPSDTAEAVSARDLLRRGALRADELGEQPVVQARMLDVIGQLYLRLGQFDEAERLLERAVALRRAAPGPPSTDLAESLIHLGWVHRGRGDRVAAERLMEEALRIRESRLPADHPEIAVALHEFGWVAPDNATLEHRYRAALEMLQRTGAYPSRQVQLLRSLSTSARRQGREAEAVSTARAALEFAEREFGAGHYEVGQAMINLADHLRDIEQDLSAAERHYRRGLSLISQRYGEDHVNLIHALTGLATLHGRLGDHAEAERFFRRILDIRMRATGPDHPSIPYHLADVGTALSEQGRLGEAEAVLRQAIDKAVRIFGPRHVAVGRLLPRLARVRALQGRADEADRLFEEAIALHAGGEARGVRVAEIRREYGRHLTRRGRFTLAERQLLESLELLDRLHGDPVHPNNLETRRALMELYGAWRRPDLVERYRAPPGFFVSY